MSWPASMPYVTGSDGDYSVTLEDTLVLTTGVTYYAEITADGDGLQATWVSGVIARNRITTPGAASSTQLMQSIRMQLGQDQNYGIQVESSDGQIAHAIRLSLQEYSRVHPIKSHQSFIAGVGVTVYEPDPAVRGILEISMTEELSATLSAPEALLMGAGRLAYLGTGWRIEAPLGWAAFKQWEEVAGTIFSSHPQQQFLEDRNQLYIYSPIQNVKVALVGALDFDVAFDEEPTWVISQDPNEDSTSPLVTARLDAALASVPSRHHHWVRSLSLAQAMMIVGRMRRKYGTLPGTDRDIQLDGAAMVSDGMALWEKTVGNMTKASPHFVPVIG
jgi:hypothetical protein